MFEGLYEQRNATNSGDVINLTLDEIDESNMKRLEAIFHNIDFITHSWQTRNHLRVPYEDAN